MIQISTPDCDYVVDALSLRDQVTRYLKPIFESLQIVKVFHGCDADIPLMVVLLPFSFLPA